MHRVVPQLIVENYRAGRYSGDFPAVGMFLDLSGFSTMTDALMQHGQHGAEVLAGVMHSVFDPLVESVFDYGGKIIGFAGDGVMALYPVESDIHSTALRALTSAYLIQKRFIDDPIRRTLYGEFSVSAKIGLSSGSVAWGILRSEDGEQATYYFRGSAVDDSAQAEHNARAGDILLTDSIWRLLQDDVHTTSYGSFRCFGGFRDVLPAPRRQAFPPVDLEVSRLFMPHEVIAYDIRGEFRQVVNLFMRFPNLTEEQLRELMSQVFRLRGKYGGLLNRLDFGDKGCNLLLLWGAPVAYENDILRALNFLLELKSQVAFPITSGVTYYVAHAGYLGSVMCEDYTCYGWGVNLASRFMMSAPSGETWVDDRIARRVAPGFEIEFLGRQHFKGFAAEQTVHRLRGQRARAGPIYQGELVGREPELEQLTGFLEPLWHGRFAGLLLVWGDAGVGKGRLVHEFRSSRLFEGKKILWAVCQSDQILQRSLNPLRNWLSSYLAIPAAHPAEERRQVFTARLDALMAGIADAGLRHELDRTRSFLGALLGLHWEGSPFEQLDAEGRYNNTWLALIAFFKAESLRQPVVLFLEDLHFTDHDSKEFLPRLKRAFLAAQASYPFAIIVTTRPLETALSAELVDARIDLRGISRDATARLAETMLAGAAAPGLISFLWERSEGNPYFVEQIIRYLQEESLLEMSPAGWSLVRHLREDVLPGDIRSVLVARLDQLRREVRQTIQTASILGREFEVQVLLQMLRDDGNVLASVAEAEKAAIWAPLSEIRYIFSHGLLRDAAYEMQMRARRQELHALAVEALESLYADRLEAHYAELAYHADHADLRVQALKYYTLAGEVSADLYQNNQAVDYYSRALDFTPPGDLAVQFSLYLERAGMFNRLGDRSAQAKDLQALEILAGQLQDSQRLAQVNMLWAHYHISTGDYPAVIRCCERVMKLSMTVKAPGVVLDTYRVWPLALLRLGQFDAAMRVAREGRERAQVSGDPVKEAYILNAMGLIAIEQRNPGVAHGYLEQAFAIARATGDKRLESITLGNLGNSAGYVRRDYAAARDYYEKNFALAHQLGERSSEAVALGNLGWVAGMQGDFESSRASHERALLVAREVGNLYLEINTLINLSAVHGMQNAAQASLNYAESALELSRRSHDRSGEAWALLYSGYAYLLFEDPGQAEAAFRASVSIREELGQPGMRVEAAAGLIQALLLKGEPTAALKEADQIIPALVDGHTLEGTEEPLRIYYACYLALERAGDPRSQDVLRSAARLLEAQVARLRDDSARRLYVENFSWRLAIWRAWRGASTASRDTVRSADRPRSA